MAVTEAITEELPPMKPHESLKLDSVGLGEGHKEGMVAEELMRLISSFKGPMFRRLAAFLAKRRRSGLAIMVEVFIMDAENPRRLD